MSSVYDGHMIQLSVFGQSHAEYVGVTIDGLPAGIPVDFDELQLFLDRRAPGQYEWSTPRKEKDIPEFLCGLKNGFTCGAPLTAVIRNANTRSLDYDRLRDVPRPGHADYTAQLKYGGFQDASGGGHFSGRLTAPLCIAGGILLQILNRRGVRIRARIFSIGGIRDLSAFSAPVNEKVFPTVDDATGEKMKEKIRMARDAGDSVGGIIECMAEGIPGGLGRPMFEGIENNIARLAFAIPAVKGIEFGDGFAAADQYGSENNDAFVIRDNEVHPATNHAGGILGGITTGEPIVFRLAVKPTPSISRPQESANMKTKEPETLCIQGRHDPCIVPRAVPVSEAVMAIALSDFILEG